MLGRLLLDNEDWTLNLSLFGTFKVTFKQRGHVRKAPKSLGHHFLRVCECLTGNGIEVAPGSPKFESAANDFCETVWGNQLVWRIYLEIQPHQHVEELCNTSSIDLAPEQIAMTVEDASKKPQQLAFKSNEAAFKYACKYMNTSLENEMPVLAVVIEKEKENDYVIKRANPDDSSIPSESMIQLIEAGNIKNISFGKAIDSVPSLQKGDLVLCFLPAELVALGPAISVIIVAKVNPIVDLKDSGMTWVTETRVASDQREDEEQRGQEPSGDQEQVSLEQLDKEMRQAYGQ